MTTKMLRRAIVATALVGAIAAPSAMACGGGQGGPSGPPDGTSYKQPAKSPYSYAGGRRFRHGSRGDCNPTPPPVTPPVDPPPVDPPAGPAL